MEYMRLEGFLGGAVSKLINKGIETKIGYKPNIDIENLNLSTTETIEVELEKRVVLDLRVSMSQTDFEKLIGEVIK